ncbi:hypothetical protein JKF63_03845 [Porcisia hertigi]|uniref:Uncharacterized protein n=1 Tax=Porcisia hertigi TaxID=2761500 RepID=A0A836I6F7_9TRYP|nr:hypothetical protein JKF63_03845 [Porcisia hertigi]
MAKGGAADTTVITPGGVSEGSEHWARSLSRAAVTQILEYTPHIPSTCCAAAHPSLRYAYETISGVRATHFGADHRSDLFVCWDWKRNREYHRLSGTEEQLEADLMRLGWWLTRPFTEYGEPMIMEVNVKPQASSRSRLVPLPSPTATATEARSTGLERVLLMLTQPPFQRTDLGISCLRSLVVTHNRAEISKTALGLLGQLTRIDQFESFTPFLSLPLPALQSLGVLRLHSARSLTNLDPLRALSRLCHLSLSRCTSLCSLEALSQLSELRELRVDSCRVLDVRGDYSACRRLTSVSMRRCSRILHAGDLATLPMLRDLDCSYSRLQDAEALMQCTELRRLCLRGCQSIHELFRVTDVSALLSKRMRDVAANAVEMVSAGETAAAAGRSYDAWLPPATSVTEGDAADTAASAPDRAFVYPFLSATGSPSATSLSQLEELDLGESNLVSLVGVTLYAPELRHLIVRECQQLRSLGPLGVLLKLNSVDASFSGVEDLEGLSKSVSLQYVNLMNCVRLRTASPLARVKSLREIDLSVSKQNCIICVHNFDVEPHKDRAGGGCTPRRRIDLLEESSFMFAEPVRGLNDICMHTALTRRSGRGFVQHHIPYQEMESLLCLPLEQLLAAEAHPKGGVW